MNRQNSLRSGTGRAPSPGGGLAVQRSLTALSGPRSAPVVAVPPNGGLPFSHPNPIDRSLRQNPSNTPLSNVNGVTSVAPQSQSRMAAERGDVRNSATLPPRERRQLPPRIHRANTTTTQQMDHASEQSAIPTPSRPVPSRIASTRQHNMNYGFNDASPDAPLPPQQPQQYQQQVPMRRNPSSTGREPVNMVLRDPYGQAGSTVTRPPRSPRIAGMEASGAFSSTMGRSSPLEPPGSVTASVVDEYSGIGASINQSEGNGFAPRTAFRRPGAPAKTANRVSLNPTPQILEPEPRVPSNERPRPPRGISKPTNPPPPPPSIEKPPIQPPARAPANTIRPLLSIAQAPPPSLRPAFPGASRLPTGAAAGNRISVLKQQHPATPLNVLMMEKGTRGSVLRATVLDEVTGVEVPLAPHESEDWDESTDDEEGVVRLGKGAKVKKILSGGAAAAKSIADPAEARRAFAGLVEGARRSGSPQRAAGRALKSPAVTKAPLLPIPGSGKVATPPRQSVLKFNAGAGSLAVNGLRAKPRGGEDGDDSDAATEEMDDVDYLDSYAKMNMVPPRGVPGRGQATSTTTTAKSTPTPSPAIAVTMVSEENIASAAELEELRVQLEREKAQGARLRQALELSKGDIAPILDLLQEKEQQLELFKEAVLAAKSAVDETRGERDDALNGLARTKNDLTQQLGQLESELETIYKERQDLQTKFTALTAAKVTTEKDLALREKERDDAERELDTLLEEREAAVRQLEDKSKGLVTAEGALARLAKEVDDLKKREQESIRRLQEAESRVNTTEAALRKAEVTANYAANEVKTKGMVSSEIEEKLKATMKDLYFAQAREAEVDRQLKEAESRLKFSEDALMESEMALENAVAEIGALKSGQEGAEKVLRDEIDTLNNDLDNLASELDEKNAEVEKAHDTIGDLDIKINGLEADLELARDEIDSNAKTTDDIQSQLDEARAEKMLFVKQIMELKQAHALELATVIEQAQGDGQNMEALTAERLVWESRVRDLEEALAQAEMEREEFKGRCDEMEQDLDDIIRENNEKIGSLTATLQELGGETGSRIEELHHELNVAKNNAEAAQTRIQELEVAMSQREDAASAHLRELEEAAETAKFERDEAEERAMDLEERLKNALMPSSTDAELTQQIRALEESLAGMMAEKNNWQGEAAELEGQMEELWGEKEGLIERVAALEKELKEAQEALAEGLPEAGSGRDLASSADVAALEQARDQALEEVRSLTQELEELRNRKLEGVDADLKDELEALIKERDDAQAELGILKADILELETMFEEAQAEVADLRTKLLESSKSGEESEIVAQLEQELDDVMAEVDELRQKLQVAESAPESAQPSSTPSIAQLERELDQANAEIVALNAKLETAEASAAATTVQTSSSTEVAELEEELEEATAQIIELRKKLEIAETTSAQATKGDDVSEEVDDLKTHLSSAKEEIQELKAQLEQVSGAGLSAEDTAKISDLEAQLDDSRQEADELFARVQELESLASGSNLDELQRLLNEEKMRSSTLDATNKSLTTEVTSLHERLARQTELSKADVDTQAVIDKLEAEIEQLKSELDNNLKAYDELEAQYSESENVNKELNHSLDLADQEIETLNRELDDVYAADTVKELEETKVQLADCLAKLQNGGSGASSVDGGADVDALVEDRVKTREDDFVKLEAELRSQIEIVEEQAREGKASLVQQLQDQQEDAKEMRETLVARLRQQESEAATLREDLSKLQVDFSETTSNLKTIEKGFDDFRVRAQGLEKRYLERVEFVEAALDQTYAEIESLRSQIIQSAKDQGVEPPTFKPLEPLPPANYDDKEEVYDAPKTGFLSSLWKGRRPTVTSPKEDKKKELPGRVVATPQPTDEPRTVSSPTPSITAGKDGKNVSPDSHQDTSNISTPKPDAKTLKNKQSTGILSSLWGGRGKNPEGASDSQTAIQTSTLVPEPSPSEPVATAATSAGVVNVKDVVVGADDDDVPQQPPSKFLASIWGAKTKLKRTDSEIV